MKPPNYVAAFVLVAIVGLSGCQGRGAQAPPAPQSPTVSQAPPAPQTPSPSQTPPASPTPSSSQTQTEPAGQAAATVSFTDIKGIYAEQVIKDMGALGIFGSTTGEFRPNVPITRAEFVRWLVKANNVYYQDRPGEQIRLAESTDATFVDIPATHPDFKSIQGMANAGYVIGIDEKHFAPDRPITREEMISIKVGRDAKGERPVGNNRPSFSDVDKISKIYWDAVYYDDKAAASHNIERVWGPLKAFGPQKQVTRGEAALCLSVFDGNTPHVSAAQSVGRSK